MDELRLQADDDHVQRLAHENDPVRAVVELIWNAVDSEADTVTVEFERNEAGGVVRTTVTDDGHGISENEIDSTFGPIGGSWKRSATRTKNHKRGLHGERGEGRGSANCYPPAWPRSFRRLSRFQRLELAVPSDHSG